MPIYSNGNVQNIAGAFQQGVKDADFAAQNLSVAQIDSGDPFDSCCSGSVYSAAFVTGDWVAGSPNTLTITGVAHGLGAGYKSVHVFDDTDDDVTGTLTVNVDPNNGNVVVSTAGAVFDGGIYIS